MIKRKDVGYIRCSTDEQSRKGFSIEGQKTELLHKVSNYDIVIDEFYEDDGSTGSNVNRRQLQKMLHEIKKGNIKTVVVVSKDRLIRNTMLEKALDRVFRVYNVELLVLSDGRKERELSPEAQMAEDIKSIIAEGEIKKISPRTLRGLKGSAELGNYTKTRVPYGYKRVPNPKSKGKGTCLEIIEEDAIIVRQIFEMAANEQMTLADISRRMSKEEFFGRKKWCAKSVKSIISNKVYIGTLETDYFYQENHQPAIIDKELFNIANEMIFHVKRQLKHDYIFSHKIMDMDDNGSLLLNVSGLSETKKHYHYYFNKNLNTYLPENKVWEAFEYAYQQLYNPDIIEHQTKTLKKSICRLENKKNLLEKKVEWGVIDLEEYERKCQKINKEIQGVEKKIKNVQHPNIQNIRLFSFVQRIDFVGLILNRVLYFRSNGSLQFEFKTGETITVSIDKK